MNAQRCCGYKPKPGTTKPRPKEIGPYQATGIA